MAVLAAPPTPSPACQVCTSAWNCSPDANANAPVPVEPACTFNREPDAEKVAPPLKATFAPARIETGAADVPLIAFWNAMAPDAELTSWLVIPVPGVKVTASA